MSLRVLVVDDTIVFRRAVSDALAGQPDIEVIGTAANGKLALARMSALQPDLVTLDIEMPELNGIEVLQAMAAQGLRAGVIVLSSLTTRGGEMTMKALELGAFDFLTKPDGAGVNGNVEHLRARLLPMIRAYARRREIRSILNGGAPLPPRSSPPPPAVIPTERPTRAIGRSGQPFVLIGVSTGGPVALARLLPALPRDLGAPVFIVQHMPALFTKPLAVSLAAKCAIRVKEAEDGEPAVPNCAYIAPGGMQMKLSPASNGEILVRIANDPPENNCKPAVDYLFRSAALNFPGRAVATILTGMGNDGTAGLRMLKRSGCFAIAQDEPSCVVFGMPREAIQAGVVDVVEPLDRIAAAIVRSIRGGRA
ncbi:MAG TPA: chemotaxis response regulator protein-glutamate methylesterase [Bryobacteraceae bacterium]|jgi:two-component system chemotaxis response regulator CheB